MSSSSSISFPFIIHALGSPTFDKDNIEPVQPVTRTINELKEDELLVKIEYASLNSMDPLFQHTNMFHFTIPLILGFDFSGQVVAVGSSESCHKFSIGDKVLGSNFQFPSGGCCFATHVVVKHDTIVKNTIIPSIDASTYGIAFITAHESLITSANIQQYKGKTIFIPGGAGGVAHFAVQIAKLYNLYVISSTSKLSNMKLLQSLHVDHIIDYKQEDVIKKVMEITNGEGVDLVYDSTCQYPSLHQSSQVIKEHGIFIKLGAWEFLEKTQIEDVKGNVASHHGTIIIGDLGRYSRIPEYRSQNEKMRTTAFEDAMQWYQQGVVRPHITSIIPFNAKSLQSALDGMYNKTCDGGKIVVNIGQTEE